MVNGALTIGAVIGVALSGGFVYWQVGRFAAPQVPVTVFDERREVFAYTAGLFVGVPLSLFLLFVMVATASGALVAAALGLAAFAGATEAAQWGLLKTRYFGEGAARPFYALGLRAGIGGILSLAIVTQYLGAGSLALDGMVAVLVQSIALVALLVTGSLISIPSRRSGRAPAGGAVSGGLFTAGGLALLAVSAASGPLSGTIGAGVTALVAAYLYRQRREVILTKVPAPGADLRPPASSTPYGRTDR